MTRKLLTAAALLAAMSFAGIGLVIGFVAGATWGGVLDAWAYARNLEHTP